MNGGNKNIGYSTSGDLVSFRDGIPLGAKKAIANSWRIPAGEFKSRFFRMGDKTWLAKCNVYREDKTLKTMWAARLAHKRKVAQCQLAENSAGAESLRLHKQSSTGRI
jgi:hypothetical protein